jgi:hypothetical protein
MRNRNDCMWMLERNDCQQRRTNGCHSRDQNSRSSKLVARTCRVHVRGLSVTWKVAWCQKSDACAGNLVTKRTQKRVQSRHKNGCILVTRCNSGAAPVQFRMHDTIHVQDTRGHMGGSSRKTRHGSGAVPVQFRHTRSHKWLKSQDAVQFRCSSVTHETRHIKKIVVTVPRVLFSENASVGGPSQQTRKRTKHHTKI